MSKRITITAMLLAVAMVLGYLESAFFAFPGIPGLKMGLANIVVLLALYRYGAPYALGLSVGKALLSVFLFGNPSALLYALLGSLFSWGGMCAFRRFFGMLGVSVIGSVLHNFGQLIVACFLTASRAPLGYAPALLLGGTFFGVITGSCAKLILRRTEKKNGSKF